MIHKLFVRSWDALIAVGASFLFYTIALPPPSDSTVFTTVVYMKSNTKESPDQHTSESHDGDHSDIALRSRLIVGLLVGIISGTFVALIIAVLCLLLWLVVWITGWGGGITATQVVRSGVVLIACVYAVSIVRGVWENVKRNR